MIGEVSPASYSIPAGKRPRGRPKTWWKWVNLRPCLVPFWHAEPAELSEIAADRGVLLGLLPQRSSQ